MHRELKLILKEIETLRRNLETIIKEKGLADPEVITASMMVDSILNEYHNLLMRKAKT